MSNVVPHQSKISSDLSTYRTEGDFDLVRSLLKNAPYNIPNELRDKVIKQAEEALESGTDAQKLAASKLILEADKRNIDLVKIAMPHKVETTSPREMSDNDLEIAILGISDAIRNRTSGIFNGRALE